MTDGQRNDIIATMVGAMPSLNFDEAQAIIGNKSPLVAGVGDAFKRYSSASVTTLRPTIPNVGVEFELSLDAGSVDPLEMVRGDGYDPKDWQFKGTRPQGKQTRRFKLVAVGYQPNLDAVRSALKAHGVIPEGQWREAFRQAYPKPDGKGPIGFADLSWVSPDGNRFFPYLDVGGERWLSDFDWAGISRRGVWRWLVACPPVDKAGKSR
ncbi:MAG: hypothetical protein HY435_02620 [Candidatus Liptonbacteria bacterium]|nr:hypothetical protein [Candidatus Liptonbacteria bacterium]